MPKILVVDDEADLRGMIVVALRSRGYETIEAENGIDAYNLAKTQLPQLIISDVTMASGSGFMLWEFLKKDDRTDHIPVILMTGDAQRAGAWGSESELEYIEKPFSIDTLLAFVQRKLGFPLGS